MCPPAIDTEQIWPTFGVAAFMIFCVAGFAVIGRIVERQAAPGTLPDPSRMLLMRWAYASPIAMTPSVAILIFGTPTWLAWLGAAIAFGLATWAAVEATRSVTQPRDTDQAQPATPGALAQALVGQRGQTIAVTAGIWFALFTAASASVRGDEPANEPALAVVLVAASMALCAIGVLAARRLVGEEATSRTASLPRAGCSDLVWR